MTDDGRLDLDDLGQVVERATPLDAGSGRDELAGGSEAPTWSERSAPARAWVRRHRVAVAAATACAVALGAGAATWQARRPPPPPTELAVSLSVAGEYGGPTDLGESLLEVSVRAVAQRPGETARVLGLVGSGLVASHATSRASGVYAVRAVVDCGLDPAVVGGAAPAAYLVEVETTDGYGRTLRGRLPVSGVTDFLGRILPMHCAQVLADRGVRPEVTSARRDGTGLVLTVSVRNDTEQRVLIAAAPLSGTLEVTAPAVAVPPGRDRFWEVRLGITDCADPQPAWGLPDGTLVGGIDPGGVSDAEPVLETQVELGPQGAVTDPAASYYQGPAPRLVPLGPAAPALRAWVAGTCAGRAAVTARVLRAGAAVPAPVAGDPELLAIPVSWRVDSPAGRVRLAPVVDPWNPPDPRLVRPGDRTRAFTTTTGGAGATTYDLWWLVSCRGDLTPPRLAATVLDDGRRTPWRLVLDDVVLADALIRACPVEAGSYDALTGWGWDLADGSTWVVR